MRIVEITEKGSQPSRNHARIEYRINAMGCMNECTCELKKNQATREFTYSFRIVHRSGRDYLTRARHSALMTTVPEQVETTDAIFDVCKWLEGEGFHRRFVSMLENELNAAYEYDFDSWWF